MTRIQIITSIVDADSSFTRAELVGMSLVELNELLDSLLDDQRKYVGKNFDHVPYPAPAAQIVAPSPFDNK